MLHVFSTREYVVYKGEERATDAATQTGDFRRRVDAARIRIDGFGVSRAW